MKDFVLVLDGLNCATCAVKIEDLTKKLDGVEDSHIDLVSKKMKISISEGVNERNIVDSIKDIVEKLEPPVIVKGKDDNSEILNKKPYNKELYKIVIGLILFSLPFLLKFQGTPRLIVYLLAYLVVGYEVIIKAFRNLFAGQPFDENFLMTIATIGAFFIGEYPEGVAVMLFYLVGEYFQDLAVNHSRQSISSLMDIASDYANLDINGQIKRVDPNEVHIGDTIVVKAGEKVPLDGLVIKGKTYMDTSNITGESVPRFINVGERVLSGFINHEGLIKVRVEKEFEDSTVSKILDLVENASSKKAPTESFITKFAKVYTPIVVFLALAIAILPPLFLNLEFKPWIYRALVFLVISCPCALVISIPLGFFGGIGGASKKGILIKGGNYLQGLNDIKTLVFDKTGTLTKGVFQVTNVYPIGADEEELVRIAAYGEYYSNHPIGKSIVKYYNEDIDKTKIKDYKEISGQGIMCKVGNDKILLGNKKLMDNNNIKIDEIDTLGSIVYIGRNKDHIGTIVVADQLKENVVKDISNLKKTGIEKIIMLSGDNEATAKEIGQVLGIDEVYGDLLPQDKVSMFEKILSQSKSGRVAFVGDGVNDSPVLARADIGIAMGALGSDAAIEASDIVLMTDEVGKINTGFKIARITNAIVKQNIVFAIGVKIIIMLLGLAGIATMWGAVFADVGVSVLAVLNSIRTLRIEE